MLHTLVSLLLVGLVSAHVRWQCPTPRSDSDRLKLGPCGTNPADNGIVDPQFSKVEIQPGPLTVSFEEVRVYGYNIARGFGVFVFTWQRDGNVKKQIELVLAADFLKMCVCCATTSLARSRRSRFSRAR